MAAPDALEVLDSVPQRAPAQPAPESFQVTPLLCGSFCTVAMKLWERLTGTVCTTGRTETVTCGAPGTIVMSAPATAFESATDVAVSVIVGGFGNCGGAV